MSITILTTAQRQYALENAFALVWLNTVALPNTTLQQFIASIVAAIGDSLDVTLTTVLTNIGGQVNAQLVAAQAAVAAVVPFAVVTSQPTDTDVDMPKA